MKRILNFYNEYHLGDCLYSLDYLIKISQYDDFEINFYCRPEYFNELKLWLPENSKIALCNIFHKPYAAINLWINAYGHFDRRDEFGLFYDKIYLAFYQELSKNYNLPNIIKTSNDLLIRNQKVIENLSKFEFYRHQFDILFINSKGYSHQWRYNEGHFNYILSNLKNQNYNVITTEPNFYFPSTKDYNLSLLDIGTLSIYCNSIIGVHTAPHIPTMNIWNINDYKEKYYLFFHNLGISYSYPNVNCFTDDINLDKLKLPNLKIKQM